MTISYNWLHEYLPKKLAPEHLSEILTSIGLEVESMEKFEAIKGNLEGLMIGEVKTVTPHPNADKLRLATVDTGADSPLRIVCGAPNVAVGQKVVVAPIGSTIYPTSGDAVTMQKAKIRGEESEGMICAEDEIGLGTSHAGIMVLNDDAVPGTTATAYFKPYTDVIYEIGLTPNRSDAMSHWCVARDVCAYLSHHEGQTIKPVYPQSDFGKAKNKLPINVTITDEDACPRYSGICISGIQVSASPQWLQHKLAAIGQRSINNIVDITNFILHETGQPLHAFDYDKIRNATVVVRKATEGEKFITLDEKERTLSATDLLIADEAKGLCIAGVFGGANSGVTNETKTIFLESAAFDASTIRKTSFRQNLRTDAATRFEKGIDISNTVAVLERAAALIMEVCGGEIASDIIDEYNEPQQKTVSLTYSFLKRLSGKIYQPDTVQNILTNLGFKITNHSADSITVIVPPYKRDVTAPADLVEEIIRIDGLNNIEIPQHITIAPAIDALRNEETLKAKLAQTLAGMGWSEILTNSISNSAYFEEGTDKVKLLNNLSSELDVLRPAMLPTALEVIAYNTNRKQAALRLFEWGKTYNRIGDKFSETAHLCLYLTKTNSLPHWKTGEIETDIFYLKGVVQAVCRLAGADVVQFSPTEVQPFRAALEVKVEGKVIAHVGEAIVPQSFDIKTPVLFADIDWQALVALSSRQIRFTELPRFPAVQRDLAVVVDAATSYAQLESIIKNLRLQKLQSVRLFDVFKSEKLGLDKKSMALNFTFLDKEKTLTDKEIEGWMQKIITALQTEISAEIRK